jgi:hypothetical protein
MSHSPDARGPLNPGLPQLLHVPQVAHHRGGVMGALEVGDETLVELILGGDRSLREVQEPGGRA